MTRSIRIQFLLAVLCASSAIGVAQAQGIPVFDASNVAQAISQVLQLEKEVQQELQLFNSLNGVRGFGSILSNPVEANSLPANWMSVYTAIQNGGYAGLTGSAQQLRQASQIYNCEDQTGSAAQLCERDLNKPFQDKAFGEQAYQTEMQELNQIQGLLQEIDATQDPKGIAELQARIQTETTTVNSEMTKLQLFRMLVDDEDHLVQEQGKESAMSRAAATGRLQDTVGPVSFGQ
ncbi:P-type DNA transfer protein VirB5 [Caballeronia sp. KNU42]